jgi:hypothetical protein
MRIRYRTAAFLILLLAAARPGRAQTYTAAADLLFYGDNTEFANPFRDGQTLLGVSGRVFLDIAFNDAVKVRGGVFGLGRFGSHEFLEQGEPMIALELSRGASRFVFGSLETVTTRHDVKGPDRETLHDLLPPLQQETLTFSRGQEMGLQWLVSAARLDHDAWINWQRLNTAEHRERFDAGYRAGVRLAPALQLHGQWHVVHEGGQQFDIGPVSDSHASALGLEWSRALGRVGLALDGHAVATRHVPDREQPALTEGGLGLFARVAADHGPWRTHLVVWRSRDTLKEEGDANYLAMRTDGTIVHQVRDYAELGLTRHFHPAPGVDVFAAARLHRVESHYAYSYRIVGRVTLRHRFSSAGSQP